MRESALVRQPFGLATAPFRYFCCVVRDAQQRRQRQALTLQQVSNQPGNIVTLKEDRGADARNRGFQQTREMRYRDGIDPIALQGFVRIDPVDRHLEDLTDQCLQVHRSPVTQQLFRARCV